MTWYTSNEKVKCQAGMKEKIVKLMVTLFNEFYYFLTFMKAIDWNLSKTNVTSQEETKDTILIIFQDNNQSTLKEGLAEK